MIKRATGDPTRRIARAAARLLLKKYQGKALTERQRRTARWIVENASVPDDVIGKELGKLEVEMIALAWSEKRHPMYEPLWMRPPAGAWVAPMIAIPH